MRAARYPLGARSAPLCTSAHVTRNEKEAVWHVPAITGQNKRGLHADIARSPRIAQPYSGLAWPGLYDSCFSSSAKSASASGILICCGQTASQAPHPMHAEGCLSSGSALSAMGAMKPPFENLCSL